MADRWQFWIDVGGTFTDCVARQPDGTLRQFKTLSSGVVRGLIADVNGARIVRQVAADVRRAEREKPGFWNQYSCRLLNANGDVLFESIVANSTLEFFELVDAPPAIHDEQLRYELFSHEEAPVLAIRSLLNLSLTETIPPVDIKLGTTRGTNALLERKGARTAFVTTAGFADVLRIANQDRPRLFDLNIRKPTPVYETVVEIDERLDAAGQILKPLDEAVVRQQMRDLFATGIESVAICLLHSFANKQHEELVERAARAAGFAEVSTSSKLSPLIRIVSRGDTTTVDAYLNPVLRAYVDSLRQSLPDSRLKLMTSAGGLVDADGFVGKDSILSGPAGGVIGFSKIALAAGYSRAIGFDMGGTSTDVSRFDGDPDAQSQPFDLEFETQKAGVRIVAPMLAIETVAAGGGSICGFDGVKLFVGPSSAGANPGPACYGRGGPLTVTDLNVALGRVLPHRFPLPLDHAAVQQRLSDLCEQIAESPLGKNYEPLELAEGFLEIANANMVRAIQRISVGKGYDPADYTLVTFGGAGAQHACAIARSLGMHRILIHPFAGILSAYGIGQADVRRFREQSVLQTLNNKTLAELQPEFGKMETAARADVLADGVAAANILPAICSLDLRYTGVEASIRIVCPSDGDYAAAYTSQHRQLYGYVHQGREIEVTAARVEVIGKMPQHADERQSQSAEPVQPTEIVSAIFDGDSRDTAVYVRDDLRSGHKISGPAIICEPTSTIVIEPAATATITPTGDCLIELGAANASRQIDSQQADPVLLEIFNNLFASIAEQMGVTLQKTSLSTNVKERLDFSCAVFDPRGQLVVNAPHIPVHLGAMSETVQRIIADNPKIHAGDVFVTNDPYRGGSHLPDVTVVTPVHDENNNLIFFTASRAHHAEIGGIVPGSMPPFSTSLAEEGVLIRNFKLVDGLTQSSRETDLRNLLTSGPLPSRAVDDNLADVAAQVAANNTGVGLLRDLVARYSQPVVSAYMQHIQTAAAAKMRLALREIPDGNYQFTDQLDNGAPICVNITIDNDSARVDFSGTGPVLSTNLNANRAITTAAALYVFRCLIPDDIPLNSGVLQPVELVIPSCLLNPPEHDDPQQCAAIVGGNVETSQRIVDTLLGALNVAAASQGTMNNLTFGDGSFGYYETICGGAGATPAANGASAVHTHMTNTRLTDVEIIERRYPVRIHEFRIRPDSGGAGEFAGGDGIVRTIEFLRPLRVSMLSERRGKYAPFGINGGQTGAVGRNLLRRAGSNETQDPGGCFSKDVNAGDVLTIETPGGGGCGTAPPG